MSDIISLDEIDVPEIEEHPATESVLLHGPPGTGKTTTAAARVALLLRDYGYDIGQVAWSTFRRTLAEETLSRLVKWDVLDPAELDDPKEGATKYISTTHAIANRCAGGLAQPVQPWHKREFCDELGIPYSTDQPWEKSAGKELFRYFDWMANNCFDPGNPDHLKQYPYRGDLREQFRGDVVDAWGAWERHKERYERIDFHEQLSTALERGAYPTDDILVIDEYHDATPLMARLSEMWMDQAEIVIVAGDPHQVVNQYDGANPHFFERIEEDRGYPKILLDKSYRVGKNHWGPASRVLEQSSHSSPPVMPTGSGTIREYRSPSFWYSQEGGWQTPAPTTPGSPSDIIDGCDGSVLFLTRTKMQADAIGAALERAGTIYASQRKLAGWNTERGDTRLALYNALTKIEGVSLVDVPGTDAENDGRIGLSQFTESQSQETVTGADIWLSSRETAALLDHARAKHLSQSRPETNDLTNTLEYQERAIDLEEVSDYVDPAFWLTYTNGASSEPKLNKSGRSERQRRALRTALSNNDDVIQPGDIPIGVMTIHASKGQEADDVVIYDGITKRIKQSMGLSDDGRDNEWRTWYVALTRASERLHIMRNAFGWTDPIIPQNIRSMADGSPGTGVADD